MLSFRHEDFPVSDPDRRAPSSKPGSPPNWPGWAPRRCALAEAGLAPTEMDRVFLTGGTSLVPAVRGIFETRFGAARIAGGGEFVSVAEGLALMGA